MSGEEKKKLAKDLLTKQVSHYRDLPEDIQDTITDYEGYREMKHSDEEYEKCWNAAANTLWKKNYKYVYWQDKDGWHYEII